MEDNTKGKQQGAKSQADTASCDQPREAPDPQDIKADTNSDTTTGPKVEQEQICAESHENKTVVADHVSLNSAGRKHLDGRKQERAVDNNEDFVVRILTRKYRMLQKYSEGCRT